MGYLHTVEVTTVKVNPLCIIQGFCFSPSGVPVATLLEAVSPRLHLIVIHQLLWICLTPPAPIMHNATGSEGPSNLYDKFDKAP